MKHVFYLHSNICNIVVYDYIEDLINKGNDIVVLTNRGCKFPYFNNRIKYYDLYEMLGKQRRLGSIVSISTYISLYKYKKYYSQLKVIAKEVVCGDDFIIYVPNYGIDIVPLLEKNKKCKGYYYIEEGGMSYVDMSVLKKRYNRPLTRLASFFRHFVLGIDTNFQLKLSKNFLGTISISAKAFEWNKKNKIVAELTSYKKTIGFQSYSYDYIIIVSYYRMKLSSLKLALETILHHINLSGKKNPSIAIKIHPQVFVYYPDYLNSVNKMLDLSFPSIYSLSPDYIVENSIIINNTTIYSLRDLSSLAIYSIAFANSLSYWVKENGDSFDILSISTFSDYIINVYNK